MSIETISRSKILKKFFRKNEDGNWYFVWNADHVDREISQAIDRTLSLASEAVVKEQWLIALNLYRKVFLLDDSNSIARTMIESIVLSYLDPKDGIAFCIDVLKVRPKSVPIFVCLSKLYRIGRHFDKALKTMKRCLELNGQHWQPLCELATIQLLYGLTSDAEKSANAAMKSAPEVVEVYILQVMIAMHKKEWDRAIDIAKAGFRLDSKNNDLFTQLGIAQYNSGRYTDAYFTLAEAVAIKHDNIQAYYYAGLSAYKSNKYKESIRCLKIVESHNASYEFVQYYLAVVYAMQSQFEQAAQHITKQMNDGEMTVEMMDFAARILERVGDYQGGIALQYKLLNGSESDAATYTRIGDLELRLGNIADAQSAYISATNKVPRYAKAHCGLGDVYAKQSKMDEAMQEYQIAIECDEKHLHAYLGLADAYRMLGDTTEALKYIQTALGLDDKNPDVTYTYGLIMESLDKSNEAISAYSMTLRISPTNEDACYRRACLYERNGDYAKAIQSFKNVLIINPNSADAYFHLATTQVAIARFNAAHESFLHAVQIMPDNEAMYIGFGMAMERAFQREKALEIYKQAVSHNESFYNALYHLGRLSHELGYISYTMDVQEKLDFTAPELARKLRIVREQTEMMRTL